MYQVFNTEKEFQQAAFNYVAMAVCDNGAEYISGGNIADICEETLEYLEYTAKMKELSSAKISIYLNIIAEENQSLREFDMF